VRGIGIILPMPRTDLLPKSPFDNRPMQGLHLTADLRDCHGDAALMTEPSALRVLCLAAVNEAGLTPVGELFHRFHAPDERQSGITGVVLLAESHLAVHTWPEICGVTIDAYVCNFSADNSARARRLMDQLVSAFAPAQLTQQQLERSSPA
jgi:S-adenosylmethionine decarboxylase